MPRTVTATRYVTPLREGGSLPAIMEADDDGLYVVKFHGAGQGPKALAAELIAAAIGRLLDLPVPETVLVDLDPALGMAEPDPEIQELLERSAGLNVGIDYLPGSLPLGAPVGSGSCGACRGRRLVRRVPHQRRSHPAQSEPLALASPALADRPWSHDLHPAWLERRPRGDCHERRSALPNHPGSCAAADWARSARRTCASHRV